MSGKKPTKELTVKEMVQILNKAGSTVIVTELSKEKKKGSSK
jgi:hypothetical protein